MILGIFGGGTAGLLGTVIGAAAPGRKWVRVSSSARVSVAPNATGGFLIMAARRF